MSAAHLFSPLLRRLRGTAGALAVIAAAGLMVMAGCGGGTSQYDPFVPERLLAFGDETTALTTDAPRGRTWAINGINDNGTADNPSDDFEDCKLHPNWVQLLASTYGFAFAECNPDTLPEKALNRAAAGARVAEVAAQVEAQAAAGGFGGRDLAAMMVGVNDIVELYRLFDGTNEVALIAQAQERGRQAGEVVNRLIALGAKVIVANIPDLGVTPFAVKEEAAFPGAGRPGLLSRLSQAFNERLGVTMLLDGRYVGLVQSDQRLLAMARSPASFVLANVTDAACTTPPPACTTATLVANATASNYLWAADLLLSPRGHTELASSAIARAQRNPF
jgi:phospholipase/lecithinase/hemolysin